MVLINLFLWMCMFFYSSKEDLHGSLHFFFCWCWQLYQWELQRISQPGKRRKWHLYIPKLSSFQQLAPFSGLLHYRLLFLFPPVTARCLTKIQSSLSVILLYPPFALSCCTLEPKLSFQSSATQKKIQGHILFSRGVHQFCVECTTIIKSRMWGLASTASFAKISLY